MQKRKKKYRQISRRLYDKMQRQKEKINGQKKNYQANLKI